MNMRFLPDRPIETWTKDQLHSGKFVSQIRTAIENAETPFVFGVLGDWGTGKTSVLNLLKESFVIKNSVKPYFVPIWFNAWLYENETNIIYPLLYAIRKDYEKNLKETDIAKKLGEDFLKVVTASAFALTDIGLRVVSKHITGEAVKLSDVKDQVDMVLEEPNLLEKAFSKWANQVDSLNQAYQSLLDTYAAELALTIKDVSKEDIRFVILIDDLDRCLPQTAVAMLESIKNFLSANQCVYVLGLNPKIVYRGIRVKYQGLDIDGREYLEKILNYSFYVPVPSDEDINAFATKSLKDLLPEANLSGTEQATYEKRFNAFGKTLKDCQFNNPRESQTNFQSLSFIHSGVRSRN